MTTLFTFNRSRPAPRRIRRLPIALAAVLIAVAVPAAACERARGGWIAVAPTGEERIAVFTGEFVNGAPVYRLPAITVVTRRPAEVAKTQRNDARPRALGSRTGSAPIKADNVATASPDAEAIKRCVG